MEQPKLHRSGSMFDERGFTLKVFDKAKFPNSSINQVIVSYNANSKTFRGLHWQKYPDTERKFVTLIEGEMIDYLVDLRRESQTYLKIQEFHMTNDGAVLEIPPMFAHGYLTLKNNTTLVYAIDGVFIPHKQRGIRWDDPKLGLTLPFVPNNVSPKDSNFPDFLDVDE